MITDSWADQRARCASADRNSAHTTAWWLLQGTPPAGDCGPRCSACPLKPADGLFTLTVSTLQLILLEWLFLPLLALVRYLNGHCSPTINLGNVFPILDFFILSCIWLSRFCKQLFRGLMGSLFSESSLLIAIICAHWLVFSLPLPSAFLKPLFQVIDSFCRHIYTSSWLMPFYFIFLSDFSFWSLLAMSHRFLLNPLRMKYFS